MKNYIKEKIIEDIGNDTYTYFFGDANGIKEILDNEYDNAINNLDGEDKKEAIEEKKLYYAENIKYFLDKLNEEKKGLKGGGLIKKKRKTNPNKKPNFWLMAVKKWNQEENQGKYYIPKKNTKEYEIVKNISEMLKNKEKPIKNKEKPIKNKEKPIKNIENIENNLSKYDKLFN